MTIDLYPIALGVVIATLIGLPVLGVLWAVGAVRRWWANRWYRRQMAAYWKARGLDKS